MTGTEPKPAACAPDAVLRRRAEERLRERRAAEPARPEADLARLVAELEVHQVELEMQQEELLASRAELEASLKRYADLYDFAPVAYLTLRADGEVVEANLTAEGLLGGVRKSLIGRRLATFLAQTSWSAADGLVRGLCAGVEAAPCEATVEREGAEPREVRILGCPARPGLDGEPRCRVALLDVTDLKRAEETARRRLAELAEKNALLAAKSEALSKSEDDFRYVFENSVVGKAITAPTGEVRVNRAFAEMLGYRPEELQGRRWAEITHPEDVEESRRAVEEVSRGERDRGRLLKRYVHKDGHAVWADVSFSARRDPEGRVLYFITSVLDVTERVRAEAEVARLTRLYAGLVEISRAIGRAATPAAIYAEVTRTLVEKGGFRMAWIGVPDASSPRLLVAESCGDETGYLDGVEPDVDERPEAQGPTGTAIREGRPIICNDFLVGPRALPWQERALRAGWRAAAAFPVCLPGGRSGVLTVYSTEANVFGAREVELLEGAATDVALAIGRIESDSARCEAERQLQLAKADLERRVEQRTVQLEGAVRELEAFSYSVSHDLRAPLRSIEGFGALLEEEHAGQLDAEGRRLLGVVRSNAMRMSVLIDDLLSFARVSRVAPRRETVPMGALAREAFEEAAPDPDLRARIDFRVEELPDAAGDAALLKQAWLNLLSNAVKFSGRREDPEIVVSATVEGGEAVYRVRDNGAGFEMKYADKLFGVFQRLHSPNDFPGTGVGLALVKRIVSRHGGRVWAEGEPGKGATVSFSLPLPEASGAGERG